MVAVELRAVRCGHISSSIMRYTDIVLLGMIKRGQGMEKSICEERHRQID